MALASAASRESVRTSGLPLAPSSAKSCIPGSMTLRHLREDRAQILGSDRLQIGNEALAEMLELLLGQDRAPRKSLWDVQHVMLILSRRGREARGPVPT